MRDRRRGRLARRAACPRSEEIWLETLIVGGLERSDKKKRARRSDGPVKGVFEREIDSNHPLKRMQFILTLWLLRDDESNMNFPQRQAPCALLAELTAVWQAEIC